MPRLSIPEKTPEVLTPGIRPDAIIMRSGMGESVFVPKSKYEDFERYLSSEKNLPTTVAMDALERLEIEVNIDPLIARLVVECFANLPDANERWVSIPIGLGGVQPMPARLSADSIFEFPPIRISNDNSGYVWRVSPGPRGERKLQFEARSNLRILPQGQAIRLELPAVPTVVRFVLPSGEWELNVVGNGSEVVEPFHDLGAASVAIVRTSGGSLTFNWTKKSASEQIQAIEAESSLKYFPLMETGAFRAVANLAIRGPRTLGGRRFLITLPTQSQWREPMASSVSFPGFRIGRAESADEDARTVLLLEFEESFSRTEIEVPIEWQTSNLSDSSPHSFSMLQLEGIQRHRGTVDFSVPRNATFLWEPQDGFEFVRQSQANDGSDTLTYTFRFSDQSKPLVLEWTIGDRASDLKGIYNVVYGSSTLSLNGSIELLGDVRLLPFLQLDVRGWNVDRVQLQPSGRELDLLAIRSRLASEQGGTQQNTTSIPLSLGDLLDAAQPKIGTGSSGRMQSDQNPSSDANLQLLSANTKEDSLRSPPRSIAFSLSRSIGPAERSSQSNEEFGFTLPMLSWLDQESQLRLTLAVASELTVQSSMYSLWPSNSLSESFKPAENQEQPTGRTSVLKYRVEKSKSWQYWSGLSESLGTAIRGAAKTRIQLTVDGIDVSQTWTLTTTGGIARTLRLAIPKDWLDGGIEPNGDADVSSALQLSVDRVVIAAQLIQEKTAVPVPTFISPSLENRYAWIQIRLPNASANDETSRVRKLTISKRLRHRNPLTSSPIPFDWLLPWIAADNPEDSVSLGDSEGEITYDDNIECVVLSPLGGIEAATGVAMAATGGGEGATDFGGRGSTMVAFDRSQLEPRIVGRTSMQSGAKESAIDIESVWVQSIVNAVEQRDRFVFRFETLESTVSLNLSAIRNANAEFLINGQKVSPVLNAGDVNRVDLLLDSTGSNSKERVERVYVLEVFVWSSSKAQWLKSLQAEPPSIIHSKSRAPLVWHVVVPSTVHLIGNSSTLSPGYRWKWQDLWFGRKSEWTQDKIGGVFGATTQPFVSQQTNQYVFFALDHTANMKVWTAPRYLLWAPVALFVLLGSFVVMEFRWVRKPWVGIALLLLSLAFSQWAWDLSIALIQCFVASIGIACMYSLIKWAVDRRARRRSVFASRPSSPLLSSAGRVPVASGSAVRPRPAPARVASVDIPPSTTIAADVEESNR